MVCSSCEKKLGKIITPDPWKAGARNTTESGGRIVGENKALTAKKFRHGPYNPTFNSCRFISCSYLFVRCIYHFDFQICIFLFFTEFVARKFISRDLTTVRVVHIRKAFVPCAERRFSIRKITDKAKLKICI